MTTTIEPRTGMPLSVAEFMDLELPEPDDKLKLELDDVILYIAPRTLVVHQATQGKLLYTFYTYVDSCDEPPAEIYHNVIVALPSALPRLFAPDLTVLIDGNNASVGEYMIEGVPDIVAEVLCYDRNRDLVRKRQVYAEAGIPEYWIFDQKNDTALQLELRDGQYVERARLTTGDILTTPLLPGLEIPLAGVLHHHSFRRPESA